MTIPETKMAFTIKEACRASGLSDDTLYRRHASGDITLRKAGRRTLILREDLERLLASLPELPRR